ncbi:MAG: chromosome segregation protein SMC [Cyclobacteriaceae bacterium]|jgi:cell division protein ZapB|nr:chromosome segregation protein SMC [Cyclobacteriaceae bacterium]HQQ82438.1 chromosome segregation protein SMC [Cyclobacteriaceae bacterium]
MESVSPAEPKKSNKAGIIIALLSIVIIIQSVKIYLDYNDKAAIVEQKANVEEDLATTMQRLKEIQTELDEKIVEIQKLGGDITELQKAKAEITAQLKRNVAKSSKAIKELKDRVQGYEELLKVKDEEIEKLQSVNKELFSENRVLKTQKNKLNDSINRLATTKQALATKVALASQLKAENLSVMAVNSKGKERESPFKNRQLEKLKVEFTIADNKVAPIEGKKIFIRVVDENGQVIFDMAKGSGSFMINNKEEFYTAQQEILFDNTRQKLTFFYTKGSEYPSGNYTIEVYTDGYLMGTAAFVVK